MEALSSEKRIWQTDSKNRSISQSQQFKQKISFLLNGLPQGHFFAYCLVSKQSEFGLFVTDKLIGIDSYLKQIHLYSQIPKLPLKNLGFLPIPKEIIKINSKLQFQVQSVSDQIIIKWRNEKGKMCEWRLGMGSNKVRLQFLDIVNGLLNKKDLAKQQVLSIYEKQTTDKKIGVTNRFHSQITINIFNQVKDKERQFFDNKVNIEDSAKHNEKVKNLMLDSWIKAFNFQEKSEIYNKFVNACTKKVESIIENFIINHSAREKYHQFNLIRDSQAEIYYVTLIDSLKEADNFEYFLHKIKLQQQMKEEWQSLNYLCSFSHKFSHIKIKTPMMCMVMCKSFVFYCKSSIQSYRNKQRISPRQYMAEMNVIEKQIHLKLINGKQQVFIIKQDDQAIFYFNRLSCIPKSTNSILIPTQYIRQFIKQGILSSTRDIEAIQIHISKLIIQLKQNIRQRAFFSSLELINYVQQSGLSYHYLPMILSNQVEFNYIQKLIISQMVSFALSWQIRQRMQAYLLNILKDQQFTNDACLKKVLGLFLSEEQQLMKRLDLILINNFNFSIIKILPLANIIFLQSTIISTFNKLRVDCKPIFQTYNNLNEFWSINNINSNLQITPYIDCQFIRFQAFCQSEDIVKYKLISEVDRQNIFEKTVQSVLTIFNMNKDYSLPYCSISAQYSILNSSLKMIVNYYLSYYFPPSFEFTLNSLQTQIYSVNHYYTHPLQYLTTINRLKWLAKMKFHVKLSEAIEIQIQKGIIWKQYHYLANLYSFYAKIKLKEGQVSKGSQFALQSLQYAFQVYEIDKNALNELFFAQQAFQSGNFHYSISDFRKAFELYQSAQSVLSKIKTSGHNNKLNEQFLQLYINKAFIYLFYGQYPECIKYCLSALPECSKFQNPKKTNIINSYEYKIYQILFRCYEIKGMYTQLFEVSDTCNKRYLQIPLRTNQVISLTILCQLIKMAWFSIVKQVQFASSSSILSGEVYQSNLKAVYLKKVKKQLIDLNVEINQTGELAKQQSLVFLSHRILKYQQDQFESRLSQQIIKCLLYVTKHTRQQQLKKMDFNDEWMMLKVLTILGGQSFLVGCIDNYLSIYHHDY